VLSIRALLHNPREGGRVIELSQLRQIMPNLAAAKAEQLLPHLNDAMVEFGIDTKARASAFVAQLAHESGEFRWMQEIWGPTAAQRRYEPVSELAKRLGNTQAGDGKRFKGRGPIQLTGRANYQRFGQLLGIDLVNGPERAADPVVAFRVAALFWANRGLNELADADNFREITRRINGGFNGLTDRLKYFERAKTALVSWVRSLPRAGTTEALAARNVPAEPLTRGAEAIRQLARPKRARRTTAKSTARRTPARKAAARKTPRKTSARKKAGRASTKRAIAKPSRKAGATRRASAKKHGTKRTASARKKLPSRARAGRRKAGARVTAVRRKR
jgi:predicted chitinase